MGSIAGIVDLRGLPASSRQIIQDMDHAMAHRGLDGQEQYVDAWAALSHRQLYVADPVYSNHPPTLMAQDQAFSLVYDGTLYNTASLRNDLVLAGHALQTHSDIELVLHSFLEWGDDCAHHLDGVYAFAIWIPLEKRLFLVRDRMGVKPLFYAFIGQQFLFASEMKALLCHPKLEAVLDRQGLMELFALGPARTPGIGVFKGIYDLESGQCANFDLDGLSIKRYWQLQSQLHTLDFEDTCKQLQEHMLHAVESQLYTDAPLGVFLSGGLDSSIVSAIAAQRYAHRGGTLDTFSVDYQENDQYFKPSAFQPNSDAPWVDKMVEHIQSNHHRFVLGQQELADSLFEAMRMRDLPGMADIDSSLMMLCRKVKSIVSVALSGECADEIFGGYPWFYQRELYQPGLFPWSSDLDYRASFLNPGVCSKEELTEYARARYEQSVAQTPLLDERDEEDSAMRRMFYLNLRWFMANLIDRTDRMSMASGLEVRIPFCDKTLMEFVWNIPWEMKYYRQREKGVLRKAMESLLPQDVLWRKKSPYPKTHHPLYKRMINETLQEAISSHAPILSIVERPVIERLIAQDQQQSKPWFGQLMSGPQLLAYLLQMNQWLSHYRVRIHL